MELIHREASGIARLGLCSARTTVKETVLQFGDIQPQSITTIGIRSGPIDKNPLRPLIIARGSVLLFFSVTVWDFFFPLLGVEIGSASTPYNHGVSLSDF